MYTSFSIEKISICMFFLDFYKETQDIFLFNKKEVEEETKRDGVEILTPTISFIVLFLNQGIYCLFEENTAQNISYPRE